MSRAAPGSRPDKRAAGTQRWRQLAFVHHEVSPAEIQAKLPAGLEVDLYDGRTFVGVVPFAMREIRASWMPRFAALDFLETNVRCYVRCNGEPGVYFFSLEASSWLAVKVARMQWGLPYFHARMSLETSDREVTARSTRRGDDPASLSLRYRIGEPLGPSEPGSLEHFLLERYLLFSVRRGALVRGQVYHQPYPVNAAKLCELDDTLTAAAGLEVNGQIAAIHHSDGVDVEVFAPEPV
jgi:hypothetical protein